MMPIQCDNPFYYLIDDVGRFIECGECAKCNKTKSSWWKDKLKKGIAWIVDKDKK